MKHHENLFLLEAGLGKVGTEDVMGAWNERARVFVDESVCQTRRKLIAVRMMAALDAMSYQS